MGVDLKKEKKKKKAFDLCTQAGSPEQGGSRRGGSFSQVEKCAWGGFCVVYLFIYVFIIIIIIIIITILVFLSF